MDGRGSRREENDLGEAGARDLDAGDGGAGGHAERPGAGALWGIHAVTVAKKRVGLGRPPAKRRGVGKTVEQFGRVRWTPENLARLGVETDRSLAAEWGIGHRTVDKKRRQLGIPAAPRHRIHWSADDDRLFQMLNNLQIARRLGVSATTVVKRREALGSAQVFPEPVEWTPEREARLGTLADRRLAEEWGCAPVSVQRRRVRLGIPRSCGKAAASWRPGDEALLGTDTDAAVAEALGLTAGQVCGRRKKLGIEAFARRGRTPKATAETLRLQAEKIIGPPSGPAHAESVAAMAAGTGRSAPSTRAFLAGDAGLTLRQETALRAWLHESNA